MNFNLKGCTMQCTNAIAPILDKMMMALSKCINLMYFLCFFF